MDQLLSALQSNVVNPVENWVRQTFNPSSEDQVQNLTQQVQNPDPIAQAQLQNSYQKWASSNAPQTISQNQSNAEIANNYLNNTPMPNVELQNQLINGAGSLISNIGNAFMQGLQGVGQIAGNIVNAPDRLLAQTPGMIQQGANYIDQAIPGNNILSNAGRDITNVAAGTLSLPGMAAGMIENPGSIPQTIGSLGSGIANEYLSLLQNPVGHFEQHPVNTILDVLPGLGLLGKLAGIGEAGIAGDIANAGEEATAALTPEARLQNVLSYPQALSDRGFTQDQIDQLSAPKAWDLMSHEVSPQEFAANPQEFLNNDVASVNRAYASTEGNIGNQLQQALSGLKGMPQDIQDSFANCVNSRSAAPIEGMQIGKQFQQYDDQGLQGILDFQKNPEQYPDIKAYFDQKFQQLQDQGIDVSYKSSYLPQLWKNENQAQDVYNRTLNPKNAPFTFESVIKNYEEGIANGLTPKYNTLGELAQWYEGRANKLLADNNYFNDLRQNSLIQPTNQAPAGWTQLGQGFPQKQVTLPDGSTYSGTYSAPPSLAAAINNYLKTDTGLGTSLANIQSWAKNTMMSSGIPGTGVSWHGGSMLWRNVLSSENPLSGAWTGAKYIFNPGLAQKAIDVNLKGAAQAVHDGLNLSIEDHNFVNDAAKSTNILGKAGELQQKFFEQPLFGQVIPALKLERYNSIKNYLMKNGMDEAEAGKTSAIQTNNIFGGQNLQQIARNKGFQTFLKNTIFAPDFLESTINTGKGIAQSILHPGTPQYHVYGVMARNLAAGIIAEELTNKAINGKFTFEQPGHPLDMSSIQIFRQVFSIFVNDFHNFV